MICPVNCGQTGGCSACRPKRHRRAVILPACVAHVGESQIHPECSACIDAIADALVAARLALDCGLIDAERGERDCRRGEPECAACKAEADDSTIRWWTRKELARRDRDDARVDLVAARAAITERDELRATLAALPASTAVREACAGACRRCHGAGFLPNLMDAPGGPTCACGQPSARESGACGADHGPAFCDCWEGLIAARDEARAALVALSAEAARAEATTYASKESWCAQCIALALPASDALREHDAALTARAREACAQVIDAVVTEHRAEYPRHGESGYWCEDFGCGNLVDLAAAIRAVSPPDGEAKP